MMYKLTKYN